MDRSAARTQESRKARLAILVNTIAPYRLPIYRYLAQAFDTLVLHGGTEPNRSWKLDSSASLKTRQVWSVQIPMKRQTGISGVTDTHYVHFNGGLLWWLPVFRPDLVISNELGFRTVLALIYTKCMRVPLWVWWGGTMHSERRISRGRQRLRRFLVRQIEHWISYGATSSEYLLSLGAWPGRILQIQNCVPHETFLEGLQAEDEWFKDTPGPVILSVGQLIERKGLGKLIEACGRLSSRQVPFTLVLVGNGPERERLEDQAARLEVEHLEILPNQTQQSLNKIYRSADFFVFPTLEDVWRLVVNEALWAGLPVLCSKYAGCAAELLDPASLFDPLSEASFDAALEEAISACVPKGDRDRLRTWQQVGEDIRASVLQGFPATQAQASSAKGVEAEDVTFA